MPFLNLNGQWLDSSSPTLHVNNRSFLYGDGLFETLRFVNGKVCFVEDHLTRLKAGAAVLGIEYPNDLTGGKLSELATQLAEKNGHLPNAKLRITLFREGENRYMPTDNKAAWLLTSAPLDSALFTLNTEGLIIGIYEAEKKLPGILANHKTCNALLYVLASQYCHQQGWDDTLILNMHGRVAEAAFANIFLVKGTHLHTPSLSEGPIAGVMRKNILQWAAENGFGISAGQVTTEMLLDADELLLTSVISGIRWVGRFGQKTYDNKVAGQLTELVNQYL